MVTLYVNGPATISIRVRRQHRQIAGCDLGIDAERALDRQLERELAADVDLALYHDVAAVLEENLAAHGGAQAGAASVSRFHVSQAPRAR